MKKEKDWSEVFYTADHNPVGLTITNGKSEKMEYKHFTIVSSGKGWAYSGKKTIEITFLIRGTLLSADFRNPLAPEWLITWKFPNDRLKKFSCTPLQYKDNKFSPFLHHDQFLLTVYQEIKEQQ